MDYILTVLGKPQQKVLFLVATKENVKKKVHMSNKPRGGGLKALVEEKKNFADSLISKHFFLYINFSKWSYSIHFGNFVTTLYAMKT